MCQLIQDRWKRSSESKKQHKNHITKISNIISYFSSMLTWVRRFVNGIYEEKKSTISLKRRYHHLISVNPFHFLSFSFFSPYTLFVVFFSIICFFIIIHAFFDLWIIHWNSIDFVCFLSDFFFFFWLFIANFFFENLKKD